MRTLTVEDLRLLNRLAEAEIGSQPVGSRKRKNAMRVQIKVWQNLQEARAARLGCSVGELPGRA